jgi:hypothetical protein
MKDFFWLSGRVTGFDDWRAARGGKERQRNHEWSLAH